MHTPRAGATTLILVRHGQTDSNVRGLLHGWSDVPLRPLGVEQAARAAARLAGEVPIAALYCSPLRRAHHTARLIGAAIGHEPIPVDGLKEIHFGAVEGLTVAEARERYPHLGPGLEGDGRMDLQWPGGESRFGFRQRVARALRDLLARHPGEKIVVATHGGVISAGVGALLDDVEAGWLRYMVGNCAITQLTWADPVGAPSLVCLDDRAHLDELVREAPQEPALAGKRR